MIGDQIRVTVTRIDADAVKLGFTAPSKTLIYRDEIYREIKQANREALRRPTEGVSMPTLRIDRRPVGRSEGRDDEAAQITSVDGDVEKGALEERRAKEEGQSSPT